MGRTVVWFRRDLRIADHGPLYRAARRGEVIPVFIFDRALLHHPETGSARVTFMLACLHALDGDLQAVGGRLILKSGDPAQVLPDLVRATEAEGVYAHTDCERIYGRVRDGAVNRALAAAGMKIRWFEPPGSVPELMPYPRYRQWWFQAMADPQVPTPTQVSVPPEIPSDRLPTLAQLQHTPDGKSIPPGGTVAARSLLKDFLTHKRDRYYWQLSYPSAEATTGLSPHIKFGAISVRECVQTIRTTPHEGDRRLQRSHQQLIARLRWGQGFTQRFRYLPQLELRSLYQGFDADGWAFDETLYTSLAAGGDRLSHRGCRRPLSPGHRGLVSAEFSHPSHLRQLPQQSAGHGLALRSAPFHAPPDRRRLPHRPLPMGHAGGRYPLSR
jgi:deoxyribodipyrimidine photo-lyase